MRRFASPRLGYRHGTPKAGALPTALHPVISLFYPAGRILPNVAPYQLSHTRIFNFCHYTTSKKIIKVFPVRARSYGQTRFCTALGSQPKSRKRRRRKAFRRFVLPSSEYRHGALKRSPLLIGLPMILRIRRPHAGGVSTIPVFSPACKGKMSLRLTAPELPSAHPRGRSSPRPRPDPRAPCGRKPPACGKWACADPAPE